MRSVVDDMLPRRFVAPRGTWVITPNAVAGAESVHFVENTEPSGAERIYVARATSARK